MAEHYEISKTRTNVSPNPVLVEQTAYLGRVMGALEMVPYVQGKGWAGNIGFREVSYKDERIIWVTSSGCEIDRITSNDIVGIKETQDGIVYWGAPDKKPTSEWENYWVLFQKRPDVNAILHGHDLLALETAEALRDAFPKEVALTRGVTPFGNAEFRDQIAEIVTPTNTYLIGREHGFFALGRTFEEAGMLALRFRSLATQAMIGEERYQAMLKRYHIG